MKTWMYAAWEDFGGRFNEWSVNEEGGSGIVIF